MMRRVVTPFLRQFPVVPASFRHGSTKQKDMSAADAAKLVRSGDTITVSGFATQASPEELLKALGSRFAADQSPSDLTLLFYGGPGDWNSRGLCHLAQPGMLKRVIGSHYGANPKLAALAQSNAIEAYNLPLGTIARIVRATASNQTGHVTKVGLGTMADPAMGGGRINEMTTTDLALPMDLNGEKHLFYKALPIHVAFIRGTTADWNGNVTMERESLYCDVLNQAMAARSSGGLVICQVERIAANDSLSPRQVRVPGTLVDAVVVAQPENHLMSFATAYNPGFTGEIRAPPPKTRMALDVRKVIARRAALQLLPNQVVNLGIGMPEGIAVVADEEHILQYVSLTTEPGTHGGVGASGADFGPAVNYDGLLELNQQFDFYNGGGLDTCFLGMAQTTLAGDVNVTRVGKTLTGPGGFIDISQCTKRVNLLGSFTAGGLKVDFVDGKLKIVQEGKTKKFVKSVPEIAFSGAMARANGQIVNYITERCVFTLTRQGLELIEIAPGVDLQKDILDQMEFTPIMRRPPRLMNQSIFEAPLMGLKKQLFTVNMAQRMHYDDSSNTLFIDVSFCSLKSQDDIDAITSAIRRKFENVIMKRAHVEANHDGLEAPGELHDIFMAAVHELQQEWYLSVRRHFGRTFKHSKAQKTQAPVADFVTFDEACDYLARHSLSDSDKESLRNLFDRRDTDGDGRLARDEFCLMLQKLR